MKERCRFRLGKGKNIKYFPLAEITSTDNGELAFEGKSLKLKKKKQEKSSNLHDS